MTSCMGTYPAGLQGRSTFLVGIEASMLKAGDFHDGARTDHDGEKYGERNRRAKDMGSVKARDSSGPTST